jgi:hypothetical protein
MESGARGGARLTAKTYGLGAFRNDTLYDVHPEGEHYKTGALGKSLKKYLRDDWERTKEDCQKIRERTGTASKTVKNAIKKAYYWTGIWALTTAGFAGGLTYTCVKYNGDHLAWIKDALAGGALASVFELYKHTSNRWKKHKYDIERFEAQKKIEAQKIENAVKLKELKDEYFSFMKKLMRSSDLSLDEKISLKYHTLLLDDYTKELFADGEGTTAEQIGQLRDKMEDKRTCLDRYIENKKEMECNHGTVQLETEKDTQKYENRYEEMVAQL